MTKRDIKVWHQNAHTWLTRLTCGCTVHFWFMLSLPTCTLLLTTHTPTHPRVCTFLWIFQGEIKLSAFLLWSCNWVTRKTVFFLLHLLVLVMTCTEQTNCCSQLSSVQNLLLLTDAPYFCMFYFFPWIWYWWKIVIKRSVTCLVCATDKNSLTIISKTLWLCVCVYFFFYLFVILS